MRMPKIGAMSKGLPNALAEVRTTMSANLEELERMLPKLPGAAMHSSPINVKQFIKGIEGSLPKPLPRLSDIIPGQGEGTAASPAPVAPAPRKAPEFVFE